MNRSSAAFTRIISITSFTTSVSVSDDPRPRMAFPVSSQRRHGAAVDQVSHRAKAFPHPIAAATARRAAGGTLQTLWPDDVDALDCDRLDCRT